MTTLELTAIIAASAIGCLLVAGGVWAHIPDTDKRNARLGYDSLPVLKTWFWPGCVPFWIAFRIFDAPSRLVAWHNAAGAAFHKHR